MASSPGIVDYFPNPMTNKLPEAEFFFGVSEWHTVLIHHLFVDRLRVRPGVAAQQHQRSREGQTGDEPEEPKGPVCGDQGCDPAEPPGLPVPIT